VSTEENRPFRSLSGFECNGDCYNSRLPVLFLMLRIFCKDAGFGARFAAIVEDEDTLRATQVLSGFDYKLIGHLDRSRELVCGRLLT
jgi:hypothetical protein